MWQLILIIVCWMTGGDNMARKRVNELLKKFAYDVTESNVNQACLWWTYQDKVPEKAKLKLRK